MVDWREGKLWRGIVWDHGHGATAWILKDLLALFLKLPTWQLLVLTTVVWPILICEVIWDGLLRKKRPFSSIDSKHDPPTYLWPWALFMFQQGEWIVGLCILALYEMYLLWYWKWRTG